MRKFYLGTVLLSALILAGSCKSVPPEVSENTDRDEIIDGLNGDIADLEARLAASQAKDEAELEGLRSERDFLNQQLASLQAHYNEVEMRNAGDIDPTDMAVKELETLLADEIAQGYVEYFVYNGMLIIHVNNPILFEAGRAELRKENQQILLRIASVFDNFPDRIIRVEGHTATGLDTPQYPTAWELGAARAVNVTRFFQEKAGIAPERLVAVSFGEWRPIAGNATEEGKRKNRRIEIVILNRPLYQWQELRMNAGL